MSDTTDTGQGANGGGARQFFGGDQRYVGDKLHPTPPDTHPVTHGDLRRWWQRLLEVRRGGLPGESEAPAAGDLSASAQIGLEHVMGRLHPADPVVGDVVQFFSTALADVTPEGQTGPGYNGQGAGPYAAVVQQVFHDSDGSVTFANLKVMAFAVWWDEGSVNEGDPAVAGRCWRWPE